MHLVYILTFTRPLHEGESDSFVVGGPPEIGATFSIFFRECHQQKGVQLWQMVKLVKHYGGAPKNGSELFRKCLDWMENPGTRLRILHWMDSTM